MNQRIIWMRKPLPGWNIIFSNTKEPSLPSRMIDIFWITLRDGSWSWIADREFRGKEIIRHGWSKSRKGCVRKKNRKARGRKHWSANLSGFGWLPKRDRQRVKLASKHMKL